MSMKIISFGIAKEITGELFTEFETGPYPVNVSAFKAMLFAKYPALKKLASLSVAVNSEYASDNTVINNGDEVALIPPVSGG